MNPGELIASGALWLSIPVAMLAGLVSFLSPCILPLVPGYLGFVGGAVAEQPGSAPNRRRLIGGVLLFILGFSAVFITWTVVGGLAAVFLLQWGDLITRILGVLVIVMGVIFLGALRFAQREARPHVTQRFGLAGAPLLGIALGIGWAPCTGPTLAAIVALSWNAGDPAQAALLGLAYSLGLGIPFLLVALGFGWASSSLGFLRRHIRIVNIIGGSLLIVLGLLMVTGLWTMIMSHVQAVMSNFFLAI